MHRPGRLARREAKLAIGTADVITGLDQKLLQLASLRKRERRRWRAIAAPHRRRAGKACGVVCRRGGIDKRTVPFEVSLEVVEDQEGWTEPAHGQQQGGLEIFVLQR